ncbi:MAG: serine/threonine protein kinase [Gemmatimonadota bacterium]|nr:serine/threonine protein kinase [Gemmatimonadota bacterium]MDH4349902.1 serine/threonine protein kinase [Gemmatimonadota bacterium]MDH5196409.1 serine/threonine protein kinase [Gemmatimonadota bacterium]
MTSPISLEPRITRLPAGATGTGSLPLDLLEDAARRLRALCIVITVVVGLNLIADRTFRAAFLPARVEFGEDLVVLSATGLVFWLTYKLSPRRIIDVGLAYAVLLAAVFAASTVPFNWFVDPEVGYVWSPNAVWVLVFPVMVPGTMGRTLLAAVLAAAAEPIAAVYFAWSVDAWTLPSLGKAASRLWPNILAVVVALGITRAIHRLGEKIQAARAVGNYHLVRQLGEGGMGQVWEATHRLLARRAAVKLISPDALGAKAANTEKLFRRFEREAQATAQLHSPHTIGVYDFGVARDGTFYYVMELLDGLDLHTLVTENGTQPPERVAHILIQACHSLAEAHERGLIHRDIKPANIFLCRYGLETDFVKVLDFGLVKPREQDDKPSSGPKLTQQQMVTGTPGFIAPEAVMSEAPLDGRADLYALGCVAYWLLTAREVFQHNSLMAMLMSHANQAPTPPSVHVPGIPPDLEAVVLALLEKDPAARPQTAGDLAQRLTGLGLATEWTEAKRMAWWQLRSAPSGTTMPAASTELI